ncbi:MAG TPA: hypothetical protein VL356_00290 [Acidocella sp.]|nr:hypothetical protein [Acidocella sp.]
MNKKKQKNFTPSGRALFTAPAQIRKSFCAAFFQKAAFFLFWHAACLNLHVKLPILRAKEVLR